MTFLQCSLQPWQNTHCFQKQIEDFPGGAVVKNLPVNAGNTGLSPGPEQLSHGATKPMCRNYWACALQPMCHNYWSPCTLEPMHHNYWAHAPRLLKPVHSRAYVPQLLNPCAAITEARVPRAGALQQEKPPQWEVHAPQWRVAPARCN